MSDLINYHDGGAGHRGGETSMAGALHVQEQLPRLQQAVIGVIRAAGLRGATGDEIADALGWERFRVRPRASELKRDKRIVDSGERRPSRDGISSIVWVVREGGDA